MISSNMHWYCWAPMALAALVLFYWALPRRRYVKDFKGKIVLLTGGGSGIGRQIALLFAKLGATVVIWDVFSDGMQETAEQIKKDGGKVFCYLCDITNNDLVNSVGDQVKQEVGEVDILVNNAGIVFGRPLLQAQPHHVRRTFEVNTLGPIWLVQKFLPTMLEKNSGHVVTVASVAGIVSSHSMADYCGSKFATIGWMEGLRQEVKSYNRPGVYTTIFCPFWIKTGMFEGLKVSLLAKLIGGPGLLEEDVARRVVDAVCCREEFVIMPARLVVLYLLRLLPVSFYDFIHYLTGIRTAMSHFKGRGDAFNMGVKADKSKSA